MTSQDVLTMARLALNDVESVRWTNAVLLQYLSDGVYEAYRVRPDLRLSSATALATERDISQMGTTLNIGSQYRQSLADYVCSRALMEDSADQHNADRAVMYKTAFYQGLGVAL